jgi:hypothetical protein|mmetsp:Transcript_59195/g.93913  ORF Transcript_59195/g.93913 Transcript_59195/m.93913 type:complete len:691 (-) Transcript_59195:74-2146(-)
MALQVASLLDQVALWPQWAKQTADVLNSALGEISVNPGYCILITISNRSYLLSSGEAGKLQITQLMLAIPGAATQFTEALASCKVRIVIDGEAWDDYRNSDEWTGEMMEKRRLRIEGDAETLSDLQREIGPHISNLSAKVTHEGPGTSELKRAIDEHNEMLKRRRDLEKEERTQIMAYSKDTSDVELYAEIEPLIHTVRGWLLFSAGSSMFGNMGQSNYVAANMQLDQMSFTMRQYCPHFEAMTLMWGAVASLGMRWKAFASADLMLQGENSADIMLSPLDAQKSICVVISGIAPEWMAAWKVDPQTAGFIHVLNGDTRLVPNYDPWGKGKGGGISLGEASFHQERVKHMDLEEPEKNKAVNDEGVWLFPGRRVRLHGLVTNAELNEVKGTLVEEVVPGTWHVRLDGDIDRLLKVANMKTLAGVPLDEILEKEDSPPSSKASDAISASGPESFAYSLAGTWTDWIPQDMRWDATQQCFSLDVRLRSSGGFSISRGKADKKWKSQKQDWVIPYEGEYQIRLFVSSSGNLKKVDWIMPGAALVEVSRPMPEVSTHIKDGIAKDDRNTSKEDVTKASLPTAQVAARPKVDDARSQENPPSKLPPPHSYCLAGKWMDWIPQDMLWNPELQCFSLKVYLDINGRGGFGICRGKAGMKWRSQKEEWTIKGPGHYDVRLFIKESGAIKKVDWVKLAE